ncbi:hypothetical protein AK830_g7457 [Neonectria ditissima]|uniref:Uncharacterized protein n=1 Tax=Neonectria ditissima TaxID=78410 RepID=A0A0P7BG65_9HYPO|nr:hypothetical protein AK830_g7457 [Neonectria ditissima]
MLKSGFKTHRGHVEFQMYGPTDAELKGLSKYFGKHVSTKGLNNALDEDAIFNNFFNATLIKKLGDGSKQKTQSSPWVPDKAELKKLFDVGISHYILFTMFELRATLHITTLIGIIARAVIFYDPKRPVRIYTTNPIPQRVWDKILHYWCQVSKIERYQKNASDPVAAEAYKDTFSALDPWAGEGLELKTIDGSTLREYLRAEEPLPSPSYWANHDPNKKSIFNIIRNVPGYDIFAVLARHIKIKHLGSFADLLVYLVENNKLKRQGAINADTKGAAKGRPLLGALAYLVFGAEEDVQGPLVNPLQWPVQLLDVAVQDLGIHGKTFKHGSGIQQLTLRIPPPPNGEKVLTWDVPNKARLLGRGKFSIHISEYIEIVCEWLALPDPRRPVVYHIQFANDKFETEGFPVNIVDMMAAFDGVSVDFATAATEALLPGSFNAEKPLGDSVEFSEAGFTLCRDLRGARGLRLHGVFGKFSLVNVPDWRPFREYAGKPRLEGFLGDVQIPSPTIRLALSDLQLVLWDKVKLEHVTLDAGSTSKSGLDFTFGAQLKLDEHTLFTSLGYLEKLPYGGITDEKGGLVDTTGWFIEATYDGDIDPLAIVRDLTGRDTGSELSNLNVRNVPSPDKEHGIVISNLVISLQKSTGSGTIHIAADTDWGIFDHIELAATYSGPNSWGFCIGLQFKDNLLSLIPTELTQGFGKFVEVNDTFVAFYVGKIRTQEAGPMNKRLPPPPGSRTVKASNLQLALAVSTTLRVTDKLGMLKTWIGGGELELDGYVNSNSFGLSAKVLEKIQLGKDESTGEYDIVITGRLSVAAGPGFEVAIAGDMDIRCPLVTRDLIMLRNTGFVLKTDGGVGVRGQVLGTLRDLFGIEGLEADGLSIEAIFSGKANVPELLSFTGRLKLRSENAGGHIALYYAKHSLSDCYFAGRLENLDMAVLLKFFLAPSGLPTAAWDFLKGKFVIDKLRLEAALKDVEIEQLGINVKQGFFYEASLYIDAGSSPWHRYSCFEVRSKMLRFTTMMSPLFFGGSETFFSLKRGSLKAIDYLLTRKGDMDPDMMHNGPVISISTREGDTPVFMTGDLTFIGFRSYVRATGNKDGFDFATGGSFKIEGLGLTAGAGVGVTVYLRPDEHIAGGTLKLNFDASLSLPKMSLSGLNLNIDLPKVSVDLVGFAATLDVEVGWANSANGLKANLAYTAKALGLTETFTIGFSLTPEELGSLRDVGQMVIKDFLAEFGKSAFKIIGKAADKVVTLVKNTFSMVGKAVLEASTILCDMFPENIIRSVGREQLGIEKQYFMSAVMDVIQRVHDYDSVEAMRITGELYGIPMGIEDLHRCIQEQVDAEPHSRSLYPPQRTDAGLGRKSAPGFSLDDQPSPSLVNKAADTSSTGSDDESDESLLSKP